VVESAPLLVFVEVVLTDSEEDSLSDSRPSSSSPVSSAETTGASSPKFLADGEDAVPAGAISGGGACTMTVWSIGTVALRLPGDHQPLSGGQGGTTPIQLDATEIAQVEVLLIPGTSPGLFRATVKQPEFATVV